MAINTQNPGFYGDFSALSALKKEARAQSPDAMRKAAQEFESLFTNMMLKSMRDASFGDSLTGSGDMDFYQGMFDQQLATQLSHGKGLGLADMLVQQLTRGQAMSQDVKTGQNDNVISSAASTADSTQATALSASTPREFVQQVLPHAEAAARKLGVDPSLLVAHAALETGWGQHMPANADGSSSLNLFGIKASNNWQGGRAVAGTLEYRQGKPVAEAAQFRSYGSLQECFADYAQVIGQERYANAHDSGSDGARFAAALQSGGYATDPNYAGKLQGTLQTVRSLTQGVSLAAANHQVVAHDAAI